jgi:hypothetical protein
MKKIERIDQAINFARSIASDILIYNKEQVHLGLREDDLYDRLSLAIEEGRRLYMERVDLSGERSSEHFERALTDVLVRKGLAGIERE